MHPIIEKHRDALEKACRDFGVSRLEVFGSAARGDDFDASRSDLDFVASFIRPGPVDAFRQFFGFIVALEELLGCKVDVVEEHCVDNPYFLESMNRDRRVIYDASGEKIPG